MSLRIKIVIALALLATGATVAIGLFSYTATANQLRAQIDDSLNDYAHRIIEQVKHSPNGAFECPNAGGPGSDLVVCQVIDDNGHPTASPSVVLPVSQK